MVSLGRWPLGAVTLSAAFAARDPALASITGRPAKWRGSHVAAAIAAGLHPRMIERALCLQMTRAEARLLIRGAKAFAALSPEVSQLRQRWSFPR